MNGLVFGLELMVVGFVVVFITLMLLNLIFHGLGRLFADSNQRKTQDEEAKREQMMREKREEEAKEVEVEKESLPVKQHAISDTGVSPEVIAIITGAVAAYTEKPGYRLKVRRVRRGSALAPWVIAERKGNTNVYGREIV